MSTTTNTTNNPIVLILVVAIFAAVIGFIIFTNIKRRRANWTGTVIDKSATETATAPVDNGNNRGGFGLTLGTRNAVNTTYTLRIKDDAGKEFNWSVGEGFYGTINVGDRLTKSRGTETPTKISGSAAPAAPAPETPQGPASTPTPPTATPPTV